MLKAEIKHKIPFHDVDVMDVAWHGHYVKYIELARCELLDVFHYGYREMRDSGFAWPIVDMRIKYIRPLRYDQEFIAEAKLVEWEYRLKIAYRIIDPQSGEVCTKAESIQMAIDMSTGESCFGSPPVLLEKLRNAGLEC